MVREYLKFFSPSFESRFIGAGRHVYRKPNPYIPKPQRGDMCSFTPEMRYVHKIQS